MVKYIAKPNTWFDEGTEAIPVTDFFEAYADKELTIRNDFAIFLGTKDGHPDEEECPISEFDIIE